MPLSKQVDAAPVRDWSSQQYGVSTLKARIRRLLEWLQAIMATNKWKQLSVLLSHVPLRFRTGYNRLHWSYRQPPLQVLEVPIGPFPVPYCKARISRNIRYWAIEPGRMVWTQAPLKAWHRLPLTADRFPNIGRGWGCPLSWLRPTKK